MQHRFDGGGRAKQRRSRPISAMWQMAKDLLVMMARHRSIPASDQTALVIRYRACQDHEPLDDQVCAL